MNDDDRLAVGSDLLRLGGTALCLYLLLLPMVMACQPSRLSGETPQNTLIFTYSPIKEDYIFTEGSPIGQGQGTRQNRLDITVVEIDTSQTGPLMKLKIAADWLKTSSGRDVEAYVYSHLKEYQSTYFKIPCKLGTRDCNGTKNGNVPITVKRKYLFPFDSINVSHEVLFIPFISWGEVTVYNRAPGYLMYGKGSLSYDKATKRLSIELSLVRSVHIQVLAGFLLIILTFTVVLLFRSTGHLQSVVIGFAVLLVTTILLRFKVLASALTVPSVFDICLIALTCAGGVITVKRAKFAIVPRQLVFISYRRNDTENEANLIYNRLIGAFSKRKVFMDREAIKPGNEFPKTIQECIKRADVILSVIGPQWLDGGSAEGERAIDRESDWPRIEMELALQEKKAIIPVIVRNTQWPPEPELPPSLRPLAEIDAIIIRGGTLEQNIDEIIDAIRHHIATKTEPETKIKGR